MIKLSDHLHIPTMRELRAAENAALAEKAATRPLKRTHAAAKVTRANADWITSPETANYVLRVGLKVLRARARQMAADSPYFKKFLSMARRNIIGKDGIQLQCRAKIGSGPKLDRDLNKRIEDAFYDWGKRSTCTASGRMTWRQAQRLFVTQLARDGEVLVQKIAADNAYGFTLKFIDASYLDEMYNDTLPNGNRVIMSVEIDGDGRSVAYWLTTPSSDIMFTKRKERTRTRVSADQIIHSFLVYDDESQVRGVTWFHAALLQGKDLYSYVQGVITSARFTAASFGVLETDVSDEVEFSTEDDEGHEIDVNIDVAPGSMTELPPGYKLNQFDPKQPTQNHAEFKRSMEIDLASAMDVPRFSLTGDMGDVNYSSARVGLGEEREMWRELQDFVADEFCLEVYNAWLPAAVIAGGVKVSKREYKAAMSTFWRARGWRYVDPQKEINATISGIENKLMTWTDALAEQGIDLVEHLETLKSEQELAAEYGIDLAIAPKQPSMQPPNEMPKGDAADDPDTAGESPKEDASPDEEAE